MLSSRRVSVWGRLCPEGQINTPVKILPGPKLRIAGGKNLPAVAAATVIYEFYEKPDRLIL